MGKYYVVRPEQTGMPDLPLKQGQIDDQRKAEAEKQAMKVRRVRRVKRSQVAQAGKGSAAKGKATPRQQPAVQPRDSRGRFARIIDGVRNAAKKADSVVTSALQDMTGTKAEMRSASMKQGKRTRR